MPKNREWQIVSGLDTETILLALFYPKAELTITVSAIEQDIPNAQTFTVEIEVNEIWAGNMKSKAGQFKWQGSYYFRGWAKNCPELAKHADPHACIEVTISCNIGETTGKLQITGIE